MLRGISTRVVLERYGGLLSGISLVGLGKGRLFSKATMVRAPWKQIFEDSCEEKGNCRGELDEYVKGRAVSAPLAEGDSGWVSDSDTVVDGPNSYCR
jgi:hypothetical protein